MYALPVIRLLCMITECWYDIKRTQTMLEVKGKQRKIQKKDGWMTHLYVNFARGSNCVISL